MSVISAEDWKHFLERFSGTHLLQSAEWGMLKENFGWKVIRVSIGDAGAQMLLRRILPGVTLAYIPKGPIGVCWEDSSSQKKLWVDLLSEIDAVCHKENIFLLKIEPDAWESAEKTSDNDKIIQTQTIEPPEGFHKGTHVIQPQRTLVVDLKEDTDRILARMKQKTRYNIGLAKKKNVIVQPSSDINSFFRLMEETSSRDKFFVHEKSYYQKAYDLFHPSGNCELLMAEIFNEPIAGLMVFSYGNRAWYLYGASSNVHREWMPAYLLQWQAMLWAKDNGSLEYDLWGVPDENLRYLEDNFPSRSDGLWGVYRFKRGFGGELRRALGSWDRVYNPLLTKFYHWWAKRKINVQ